MSATAEQIFDDDLDATVDPQDEALKEAIEIIRAATDALAGDPGAVFTKEVETAWNTVYEFSSPDYERLRKAAKAQGARVTEIDKLVGARKKRVWEGKSSAKVGPNPLDPLVTGVQSSRDPFANLSKPLANLSPGVLLEFDANDKPSRMIESTAAVVIADALCGALAWDAEAGTWHLWRETHWEPLAVAADAESLLANAVHIGTDPIGFRMAYLSGVTQIAQRRGLFTRPPIPVGVIPFRNGLLDIRTGELVPATPERAADWCLPHDYTPGADCPAIRAWLLRCVEGDADSVGLLRAWLAALARGIPLQKFLMLLGRGRSGKGTFQRLVTALIGTGNVAISALRDLEENRFETAKLYGKRLCMINEAGKHGGALNMLKAITGGDHIPLERKHVQQAGSFVFDGLVLMATNEDLQSSDTTSGLERRRVTVRFPRSATPEEIAAWEAQGGEEQVLHNEIPGLINWLLEMPEAAIRRAFEAPPARVAVDNLLGMAAGNSVADWLLSETTPDANGHAQIGVKEERRSKDDSAVYFEHAHEWLYASYLTHCLAHGRKHPVSLRKFSDTIVDLAETLGHPVEKRQHPKLRTQCIYGLTLDANGSGLWNPVSTQPQHSEDHQAADSEVF
ncbi:MAG: DUF5906 domain-containing protein [Chromatiaceae bacterium]|nr:DUF5906 domain-containing protein [Chromatiaceae bacterium]